MFYYFDLLLSYAKKVTFVFNIQHYGSTPEMKEKENYRCFQC